MKRAERRSHRARLLAKRHKWHNGVHRNELKVLRMLIDTPTPCSCHICGNGRKYRNEITIKEKRLQFSFHEQLNEVKDYWEGH